MTTLVALTSSGTLCFAHPMCVIWEAVQCTCITTTASELYMYIYMYVNRMCAAFNVYCTEVPLQSMTHVCPFQSERLILIWITVAPYVFCQYFNASFYAGIFPATFWHSNTTGPTCISFHLHLIGDVCPCNATEHKLHVIHVDNTSTFRVCTKYTCVPQYITDWTGWGHSTRLLQEYYHREDNATSLQAGQYHLQHMYCTCTCTCVL